MSAGSCTNESVKHKPSQLLSFSLCSGLLCISASLLLCLAFVDFRSYYGEDGERGMNMNKVRAFLQIIYGVVRPSIRGEASKMGTDVHRESFITALTTHNRHQVLLLVQHISWHLINGRVTGACCLSALGCCLL